MDLVQEMLQESYQEGYQEGFRKGFVKKLVEISKKAGTFEEIGKDKALEYLVTSLMEEKDAGIHDREEAIDIINEYVPELML